MAFVLLEEPVEVSMNERMSYFTWLCCCFLAGGAAGAGAALLLAPHSGKDTRGRMGRKLRHTAGSVRELRDRVVHRGEEIGAEAARRVDDAASALAGNSGRRVAAARGEVPPA